MPLVAQTYRGLLQTLYYFSVTRVTMTDIHAQSPRRAAISRYKNHFIAPAIPPARSVEAPSSVICAAYPSNLLAWRQ
jgi:hypothetical protein